LKLVNLIEMSLRIGKSKIHGDGMFAVQELKQGTCIALDNSRVINDGARPEITESDWSDLPQAFASYRKASRKAANVELHADEESKVVCALRNISKGQEILRHYGIYQWTMHLLYEMIDDRPKDVVFRSRLTILVRTARAYGVELTHVASTDESSRDELMKLKQIYIAERLDATLLWVPWPDGKFHLLQVT
jgi:hypothetical protein